MIRISLESKVHNFRKKNIVTEEDNIGMYDIMECTACGISGKCRDFVSIEYMGRKRALAERCTLSKSEYEAFTNKQRYEELSEKDEFTEVKCPNSCGSKLRVIAEYLEEGTNHKVFQCVCRCGYGGFVDA